jgi:hypothetical protein
MDIMKAILEFNLPADEEQFDAANRGMDWALVAWDLDQLLRNKLKYEEHVTDTRKTLEEVREVLYDLMDVKNLTFPK